MGAMHLEHAFRCGAWPVSVVKRPGMGTPSPETVPTIYESAFAMAPHSGDLSAATSRVRCEVEMYIKSCLALDFS